MQSPIIYLDHAASSPMEESVIAAMTECMRTNPFNASAAYSSAGQARKIHRLCRAQLAGMLACDPQEIFFTSGGTESNNWVIRSFAGSHMVISAIEHASVLHAAKALASGVTLVQPDSTGYIAPDAVRRAIRPDTRLICLQAANNETGVLQPLAETFAIARQHGIHLHADAVAAFGQIPMTANACDSLSLSAHKFGGPRGAGALFIRSGAKIAPLLLGGGQEHDLRAGTENTPAICGLCAAAELAQKDLAARCADEQALLDAFVSGLKQAGVVCLGNGRKKLPGIRALLLPGVSSERAIAALDTQGILISGGAACAAQSGVPSHVYTAMGLPAKEAACVIRVSIGRHTAKSELDTAAAAIRALIPAQRH